MCVGGGLYITEKSLFMMMSVNPLLPRWRGKDLHYLYSSQCISLCLKYFMCIYLYFYCDIPMFQCVKWKLYGEISLWFNIKTTFKCKIHFWLKLQENPLSCFYSVVYEICCLEKTKLKKIQTFYGQNALLYYSAYSSCHLLLISF